MNKLLDEKQAAALLNMSVKSLQAWRSRGGGQKFVKIGRRLVRYAMADLEAFVLDRLRSSTSDRGRTPVYRDRPGITIRPVPEKDRVLDRAPAAACTPPTTPRPAPRPPTPRRHVVPRGRIRVRLVRTNQHVNEPAPTRAR